jgi:predicted NBD/HSP70 family sugar kinase
MDRQRNATAASMMRALLAEGPLGRKEVAASTGTSFTTITKLVGELLDLGALEEIRATAPHRSAGRPTVPLDIPRRGRVLVGGHLHPERTSCGAYTVRGERLLYRSLPTAARTSQERIDEVAHLVREVVDEVGADSVVGVGVSKPWDEFWSGPRPQQVVDVDHADLHDGLSEHIGLPVRVDSNVRALALAQHWWGGYTGNVLSILVGRSVRLAQMRGDELTLEGPAGGGVVSHLVVPGSTVSCNCGQTGCVRVTCTDDALLTQAVEAGLLPSDSLQSDLYPSAAEDSAGLAALRRERVDALGRLVPLLIALLQPDQTVISGPIGTQDEIRECLDLIRRRHAELTGYTAQVHRHTNFGSEDWPRACAALMLDSYLVAPLTFEHARRSAGERRERTGVAPPVH